MNKDTEHSEKIIKFNFPASVYDKLYKAKLNNEYVEITLYHKHLNTFGYDHLHLNDGMIYALNKFKSVKLILSPQQLRDFKYRIVYDNNSYYTTNYPKIETDIDCLKNVFVTESNEEKKGHVMNFISHIYQKLGDILMEVKKQGSVEAKQI